MSMSAEQRAELRRLMPAVLDRYGYTLEMRQMAWAGAEDAPSQALTCYRILAGTIPPYLPIASTSLR